MPEADGHAESTFGAYEAAESTKWKNRHDERWQLGKFWIRYGNEFEYEHVEYGKHDRHGEHGQHGSHLRLRQWFFWQLSIHAWPGISQSTQSTVANVRWIEHG